MKDPNRISGAKRDYLITEGSYRSYLADEARAGNVLAFTKYTNPKYEINWHHALTAKYINAWIRGEIMRLMIFEPPRHGKTELSSRNLPALIHGLYPDDEILCMSYNSELASDMTVDVQRIMDRDAYQELFPNSKITPEGKLSRYARTSNEHELLPYDGPDGAMVYLKGSYRSAGVGGSFTGRGGKWLLIDDPIKNREDADSRSFRNKLFNFYNSSFHTRGEGDFRILLTQTRWHQDDLAGRLLALAKANPDADQWTTLSLPAIKENNDNPEDPRKIGEPLWPERMNLKHLHAAMAGGSRDWAALYQQRPTQEGGNIIQSQWIKYYKVLPQRFDRIVQSWDFAVKDKDSSDYAVGQIWGKIGADKYLIDEVRGHWDFPLACKKLIELTQRYPQAHKKLIESKAVGPAVVQTLKKMVSGLVEVEPMGDKTARLNAVAPDYESGNVYYPVAELKPWIDDHISEMCDFPAGVNDDRVDAASQALNELKKGSMLYAPSSGHGSGVIF